jgi:hypothetical protein
MQHYYESIPLGSANAVSRAELCRMWGMRDRKVRALIADLRAWDNGDDMAIVSSSHGKGYYRTKDQSELEDFRREM